MMQIMKRAVQSFLVLGMALGCFIPVEAQSYKISGLSKKSYDFTEVPAAYKNKGYVIKTNEGYGFISPKGRYIEKPEYENISYNALKTDENPNQEFGVCLMPESGLEGKNPVDNSSCHTGYGGAVTSALVYDEDAKKPVQAAIAGEKAHYEDLENKAYTIHSAKLNEKGNIESIQWDKYYIYDKTKDKVYGPYSGNESASFSANQIEEHVKRISDPSKVLKESYISSIGYNYPVNSLFYEKEGKKYLIHSAQNDKTLKKTYKKAEPVTENSMRIYDGKTWGIVDENLNTYFDSRFEEVSQPIGNKIFVKKEGKWYLADYNK